MRPKSPHSVCGLSQAGRHIGGQSTSEHMGRHVRRMGGMVRVHPQIFECRKFPPRRERDSIEFSARRGSGRDGRNLTLGGGYCKI